MITSAEIAEAPAKRRTVRLAARLSFRNIGAVYVWIVLILIFTIWKPSLFPTAQTAKSILNQYAITGLAALSVVMPLAAGIFDLSIGSTIGFAGVFVGWSLNTLKLPAPAAILLTLVAGLTIGLFNSLVVVRMRIDSFIGTLATGSLVQAFISFVTGDNTINSVKLAGAFTTMSQGTFGGVIYPVYYALALAILLWLFMEYTATGRRLYATGFNPDAARLANIKVNKLRFCSLLTSAAISGFAGVMLASSLSSGDPSAGTSYLLPAFATLFVGATVFKQGRFNAWGTLVAVLMLGTGTVGLGLVEFGQPGADLLPGIVRAVELKGHTPGHSGYRIESGADSVLVFGDAMHSYVVSVRKPSWQVAFDGDRQLGATTRIALVKSSAASGQRLYSEHFPFPGIGKIVKGKEGASWQPESLH